MVNVYPLHNRRFAIAAKEETTYGTENAPSFTTDAFRVLELPTAALGAVEANTRETWVTGGLGGLIGAGASGLLHTIGFQTIFVGPGVAYDAVNEKPNIHELLANVWAATGDFTVSSEKYTYDISDVPSTGLTVYTNKDGKQFQTLGGVVSALTIAGNAGTWPIWTFEIMGIHDSIGEADLPALTFEAALPPLFVNSSFTIGAFAPVIRSFSVDMGLTVANRADGNATNAHQGFRIVRRTPRITVTIEADLIASYDPWADWINATARALTFDIGATQYNKYVISAAEMSVVEPPNSVDLDGLSGYEVTYGIHTPASGNEIRILAD